MSHLIPLEPQHVQRDLKSKDQYLNSLLPHTKETMTHGKYGITGDAYEKQIVQAEYEWHINDTHVKSLCSGWPHLRYLVHWMQVTTSPLKWKQIKQIDSAFRNERASRTKVAVVDFAEGQETKIQIITNISALAQVLDGPSPDTHNRLYIVEDLSRDVIEQLGWKLDIDPLFFREQISDYRWFNTRDPWVEIPDLDVLQRSRPFFRLTWLQPRYFKDIHSAQEARIQAGNFNVLRRVDDDSENEASFTDDNAIIGLVRKRGSLWTAPTCAKDNHIGVLLVDPAITAGHPVWSGHRPPQNSPTPSQRQNMNDFSPMTSLFDDVLFHMTHLSTAEAKAMGSHSPLMVNGLVRIACSEWYLLVTYITARLAQIEQQIERPNSRPDSSKLDAAVAKLNDWRRRVLTYKSMVYDMQQKLCRKVDHDINSEFSLQRDVEIIARHLESLYDRALRLFAVATTAQALQQDQRAIDANRLGTVSTYFLIFAPLSLLSSILSMNDDLSVMAKTIWIYFCVAVPVMLMFYVLTWGRKRFLSKIQSWSNTAK
ncbi:hypothetical protein BJ170DRAFT_599032 [Xylariales sp. AK1849]|nr:hypothetical protein BJ170DRAFT_599032 [Xylariales sp. AK1849]